MAPLTFVRFTRREFIVVTVKELLKVIKQNKSGVPLLDHPVGGCGGTTAANKN